jgi:dTDP-glucose 4,6-dehydratase
MRFLITGGAGFLGSHLCDRLLIEGHSVTCIDNLCTGDIQNISHIKSDNFEFINYDVTNYLNVDGKVDFVLHFASPASPSDYLGMPIQTLKVGAIGTYNTLGLVKTKKAGFLLASTSEVYGDPLVNPQPETYWGNVNPIGARGVYDEAKRYAEALTLAYHKVHKLNTKIARIFNTYGPRLRPNDGRMISTFITQALKNKPITISGNGKQTRSLIYIDDQIEGIFRLIFSDKNEPINIGNPQETSVLQVAKLILELTNSKSKFVFLPLPVDDPKVRCPNIEKARRFLDWEPKISLHEGLIKTINYIEKKLG